MRRIDLHEYLTSEPLRLSVAERDSLGEALPSIAIEPEPGERNRYRLTPGSTIGAVDLGELSVVIRPKLEISRVIYLASYAMGAFRLRDRPSGFESAPTLVEALALALNAAARRAFARGLLHGYRTEQDALRTVRGRIDIAEQIRRRFDILVPVEVQFDEFTDDILANRLVKAAADLLGRMRLTDRRSRDGLRWINATLANVMPVRFRRREVPEVTFDRLNEHYREVVSLARLILRHQSLELERGQAQAAGFLINMNEVFQEFVTRALRESLGVSEHTLRSDKRLPRKISLDTGQQIDLQPDLTWWDGQTCTFVGDAKYKRIGSTSVPNADIYQLLAYATALNLPGGLLIYAKGEADPIEYTVPTVPAATKRLQVTAIDLAGSIDDLRATIDHLATQVQTLRTQAIPTLQAA